METNDDELSLTFQPLGKAVERVLKGAQATRQRLLEQSAKQEIQRATATAANTNASHQDERRTSGRIR